MTNMNTLCGASAAPHTLEHNGRKYTFRMLTYADSTAFSRWLTGRAREVICQAYPEGPDRQRKLDELVADAMAGAYDFDSPTGRAAAATVRGAMALMAISLGVEEAEAEALLKSRTAEVKSIMKMVMAESLGLTVEELEARLAAKDPVSSTEPDQGNAPGPAAN